MHPLAIRGAQLAQAGYFEEAEQALRAAPQDVPTAYNLGYVLRRLSRDEEAAALFRRVLKRDPHHLGALVNLANICHECGDNRIARRLLTDALRQNRSPELLCNMARVCRAVGDLPAAIGAYEAALALRPDIPQARSTLAIVRMIAGQWSRAFLDYEARHADPGARSLPPSLSPDPAKWAGAKVLLRWEQGFGDTIQFVRYATRVSAAGANVTIECQPQLVRLLRQLAGVAVTDSADPAEYDAHASLMSLPYLMGDEAPYCRGPYLAADPAPDQPFPDGFRVGLHWQGSPTYVYDRMRSFPLRTLSPLADVAGVAWVSFQFGAAGGQAAEWPAPLLNAAASFTDFADTAAALASVDLLITSDSAVAHLAGAMGRPVWLMVSKMDDWRWGTVGEGTPWYPSIRVFRQERLGDWSGVVKRIRAELVALQRCGEKGVA